MEILFTPWRYAYITQQAPQEGCFFCAAGEHSEDPERLVVAAFRHHLVLLNRHPYSSGHLMVAPRLHLANPLDSSEEARAEFWPVVLRSQQVLTTAFAPHAFNLGMNLGSAAGAGVPGHFHFHLVPRWNGDTNFMTVLADVRLVPEDLQRTWERVRALFDREGDVLG